MSAARVCPTCGGTGKAPRPATLAERLRALRADRGVDQKEVALATGIPAANLSRLEGGKILNPWASHLIALARFYACTIDYLLMGAEP